MEFPIFEAIMIICFGAAWPFSIMRSYKSRTNKGKSLFFLCIVEVGYACGVVHKMYWTHDSVLWFYVLNLVMVTIDLFLYARNHKLDKLNGAGQAAVV